jgi:hypothetical protein
VSAPPSASPVALSINITLMGAQVMDVIKALGWDGLANAPPLMASVIDDPNSWGGADGVTPSGGEDPPQGQSLTCMALGAPAAQPWRARSTACLPHHVSLPFTQCICLPFYPSQPQIHRLPILVCRARGVTGGRAVG